MVPNTMVMFPAEFELASCHHNLKCFKIMLNVFVLQVWYFDEQRYKRDCNQQTMKFSVSGWGWLSWL
jgi:hypothetical protein